MTEKTVDGYTETPVLACDICGADTLFRLYSGHHRWEQASITDEVLFFQHGLKTQDGDHYELECVRFGLDTGYIRDHETKQWVNEGVYTTQRVG